MSIFSLLRDGFTEVIIKIVQWWTKNNKDPENFRVRPYYPHYPSIPN